MARLIKPSAGPTRSRPLQKTPPSRKMAARPKIALAMAGGGPLGAMYEIGVLMALDEALASADVNATACTDVVCSVPDRVLQAR